MLETSASLSLQGGNLILNKLNSFYTKLSYLRFALSSKPNVRELHVLVLQRTAPNAGLLLTLFSSFLELLMALSDFTKLHPALEIKIR